MASGDTLVTFTTQNNLSPAWLWVAFTSGGTAVPSLGDTIWGDSSNATAILEYLVITSGTFAGSNAAGYMLLSNWNGTAWSDGENYTLNSGTPANDGTLTATPSDGFAALDTRNDIPVLDFDATVNEVAMFMAVMPQHYAGSGVTVHISVMASTATTGDMSWFGFFKSVSDDVDDLDTKNFAAPQSNTAVDVASASGEAAYFTIGFTDGAQIDSIATGELFFFLLMRDAQDGTNDDMAGDAELLTVEIRET